MTEHGHHIEEQLEHMIADHPDDHSHGGLGQYLAVFAALCVLTGMSFFTYSSYWPFSKEVAWAFMMAVSCTKAMLVIMFFMHLLWEANWKWVLTIPASGMSIFLLLMLIPDVGMRTTTAGRGTRAIAGCTRRISRPCRVRSPTPSKVRRHTRNRRPPRTSGRARQQEAVRGWFHPRATNRLKCLKRLLSRFPTWRIATATTWQSPTCR